MRLAEYLKGEKNTSLKMLLHRNMAGYTQERPISTLHASSLTKQETEFCPREYAIMDQTGVKPKAQFIGTSLRATFGMGLDLQDRVANDWLRPFAVGDWECVRCGKLKKFCKASKKVDCSFPDLECKWEHKEPRFASKLCGASCGIDLFLQLSNDKYTIIEIKTMVKESFITLKAPLAEHNLRTNFYMRLVAESDHPNKTQINTKEAILLYVVKGYGVADDEVATQKDFFDSKFTPFKEFPVKRNDKLTQPYWEKAKIINDYRSGSKYTGHRICKSKKDKRAEQCAVCNECFSVKFPIGGRHVFKNNK